MNGKPQPVPGKCNAQLEIGDDYGDNEATMMCQLEPGHVSRHKEVFFEGRACVEWDDAPKDEIDCDGGIFPIDLSEE